MFFNYSVIQYSRQGSLVRHRDACAAAETVQNSQCRSRGLQLWLQVALDFRWVKKVSRGVTQREREIAICITLYKQKSLSPVLSEVQRCCFKSLHRVPGTEFELVSLSPGCVVDLTILTAAEIRAVSYRPHACLCVSAFSPSPSLYLPPSLLSQISFILGEENGSTLRTLPQLASGRLYSRLCEIGLLIRCF